MDRRSAIKHVVGALGSLKLLEANAGASQPSLSGAYRIQASQITVYLSKQSEITGLVLSPGKERRLTS